LDDPFWFNYRTFISWFVIFLGVPKSTAIQPGFYLACLGAGALSGLANWYLARLVVATRIRALAGAMHKVEISLRDLNVENREADCSLEACAITIDSEDELGESARAFNALIKTLSDALDTQQAVHAFSEMLAGTLELEKLA
jgi:two-component system, cell cycle response regulator